MRKPVCKTCKFALADKTMEESGDVLCRRFPPLVGFDGNSRFPVLKADIGWCGEHKPQPIKKGDAA